MPPGDLASVSAPSVTMVTKHVKFLHLMPSLRLRLVELPLYLFCWACVCVSVVFLSRFILDSW